MLIAQALVDAVYLTGLTVVICRIREVRWSLRFPAKRGLMHTRVSMEIIVPEDSIFATCTVNVSQWDEAVLVRVAKSQVIPCVITPLDPEKSVLPYAVAALREGSDNSVAQLLKRMGEGEVLVMHETDYVKPS